LKISIVAGIRHRSPRIIQSYTEAAELLATFLL
jgi:hypothetical protein